MIFGELVIIRIHSHILSILLLPILKQQQQQREHSRFI